MVLLPVMLLWSLSIVVSFAPPARSDPVVSMHVVEAAGNLTEWLRLTSTPCPSCEEMFPRLEVSSEGLRVQNAEITLRGEPKSGTNMMFRWATATLIHTCELLDATFGEGSCHVKRGIVRLNPGDIGHPNTFTLEPHLSSGRGDPKCSCGVDRVMISLSQSRKHELPVHSSCRWWHTNTIPGLAQGCKTVNGRPVQNYADLWSCMQESPCEITDKSIQFVAMRDPRAVAVSTYFWVQTHRDPDLIRDHYPAFNQTLDESVLKILESVCQWTAIRHILFGGFMPDNSTVFWYEDSNVNPLEWHYSWTQMAGLRLPPSWVEDISRQAESAMDKGYNVHPGGVEGSADRTWKDEVDSDLWDDMDGLLRRWLPPILLARLGVPPGPTFVPES